MILSWLAHRTLRSKRRPLFVTLLSLIGIGGMALGVFSLIVVLSVMNGFEKDFRERIVGFNGALTVRGEEKELRHLQKSDFANRGFLFVEGEGILQSADKESIGVRVRGLEKGDPRLDKKFEVRYTASEGADSLFTDEPGIILGQELAATLGVHPDFEDKLLLISPLGDIGPNGDFVPKLRQFRVIGIFKSGFYEYDTKYALIGYPEAKRLFPMAGGEGMMVSVNSWQEANLLKKNLEGQPLWAGHVETWQGQNSKLFQALRMERVGMFLLLAMIILIATITIFGILSLIILDKVRDVVLLKAIGLTKSRVRKLFILQGVQIGLKGTAWGGSLGLFVVILLSLWHLPLPSSYYLDYLPVSPNFWQIALILVTAPLLAAATGFYPAGEAAKLEIAPLLRYE
ncbi:MAG: ABC transporter permease [Deltaproteobacteria bacterium]|nr:ABC transporter permease [Deltaproteobacteria bacterium]